MAIQGLVRVGGLGLAVLLTSAPIVGCAEGPTVSLDMRVRDAITREPVAAADVCVVRPAGHGCATTDGSGMLSMRVPAAEDILLRADKAGYYPLLAMASVADVDHSMGSEMASAEAIRLTVSLTEDGAIEGRGHVMVLLQRQPRTAESISGASVSVTPGAPTPLYLDEFGLPDPELTATTEVGIAVFVNLEPGEYALTMAHAALECSNTESGWTTGSPTEVRFAVEEGALSQVIFAGCQ